MLKPSGQSDVTKGDGLQKKRVRVWREEPFCGVIRADDLLLRSARTQCPLSGGDQTYPLRAGISGLTPNGIALF